MVNPWDKIFIDDFESGFIIANENYLQSADNFNLRARALCSLLIRNYQDALNDFHLLLEIEKQTDRVGDESYWDIALCYYALGNDEKAIDYFTFPVINPKQIKYTSDISIHAGILYFIAVKLNRNDLLTIATKKLKQQKKLVIPLFLLGQLLESDIDQIFRNQTDATLKNRKECKVEFYKAVAQLAKGNREEYLCHLNRCVDLKGKYLEFEYYVAKVEQDKINCR